MDYEQENLNICEKCGERIKKDSYRLDDLNVCEDCFNNELLKAEAERDAHNGK